MKTNLSLLSLAFRLALAGGFVLTGPIFSNFVFADDQQGDSTVQRVERVEVTGSNIKRSDTETSSPVLVITAQDLASSGKTSVADYLQTLPLDGAGSLNTSFGSGFAQGSTAISLRGLGANATLVLVDGRRMAPYPRADDTQKIFTDLSSIPMAMVDRIEVLKDGASSVYGADAIAGVVNIITKKDFQGMTAGGSGGISRYSDYGQYQGSFTAGWGDLAADGHNYVFDVEAYHADRLQDADRANQRQWIGQADLRQWGYPIDVGAGWVNGYIAGSNNAGASPAGSIRNPNTLNYSSLPGCSALSTASPPDPNGGCLWTASQFWSMEPRIDTVNVFSGGTWRLGGGLEAYANMIYSSNRTAYQEGPPSITPTVSFPPNAANPGGVIGYGGLIVMAAQDPQNPYGVPVRVRYSAFDVGPSDHMTDDTFTRFVLGVKGESMGWDFDSAILYSQSDLTLSYTNALNMPVVQAALGDPTSPYFPYYIGAQAYKNPASLYSAMVTDTGMTAKTRLAALDFTATRDLMPLPGGDLSLAVGAEYEYESVDIPALSGTQNGTVNYNYIAAQGQDSVKALYGEILAPLDKQIEVSAALRYDSYDSFNATTPKLGIKWKPLDALALRATYSEGFRAPNAVEDSTASRATGSASADDPVRCPGGVPLTSEGATQADCSISFGRAKEGNPDLQPEKSKNFDIGFIWDLPTHTSFTVDSWRIKRTDEIAPLSFAAAAGLPTAIRADNNLIGPNGQAIPNSGTLEVVPVPFINFSYTDVRGIDFEAKQKFNLGEYGKATLVLDWTHLTRWLVVQPALSFASGVSLPAATYDYLGTHGDCDTSNCIGTPQDKITFVANWDKGEWGGTTSVDYRSSMKDVYFNGAPCAVTFADGSPAPSGCTLASFYTINVSARWQASKSWQIFGSVDNLTDRIAPLDPLTYGTISYNPMDASGAIGRYFRIGARYRFQ